MRAAAQPPAAPAAPLFPGVTVVLPTYNEKDNIVPLIREILVNLEGWSQELEVLVVDDNSPDGTAGLVRDAFPGEPRVRVLVRTGERGLATAIRRGAEEGRGPVLIFMDTDFNHHPRYIPTLLSRLPGCDLALGSRYRPGGGMNTSHTRYLLSYLFNVMVRIVLGVKTTDNLSGFIAVKKDTLLAMPLDDIFHGYGDYAIRLLYLMHRAGQKVSEVPVVYEERLGGESKTRFVHTFKQYMAATFALRLGRKKQ